MIEIVTAWRCPTCGRATPKSYRCQNYNCEADLAGKPLEALATEPLVRGATA